MRGRPGRPHRLPGSCWPTGFQPAARTHCVGSPVRRVGSARCEWDAVPHPVWRPCNNDLAAGFGLAGQPVGDGKREVGVPADPQGEGGADAAKAVEHARQRQHQSREGGGNGRHMWCLRHEGSGATHQRQRLTPAGSEPARPSRLCGAGRPARSPRPGSALATQRHGNAEAWQRSGAAEDTQRTRHRIGRRHSAVVTALRPPAAAAA